jgi:fibronectin type 3 domain-containing protein
LAWSAPASNGGAAITGYRVYRATSSGAETLLTTLGVTTSWTDTGAVNGTAYYYKVSAVNSIGESTLSNEMSATPTAPATAPGAPTLNGATAGNGSVALAWSAPASNGGAAITGYRVYRATSSGGETLLTTLGVTTSWTDTGAVNGTAYYYKVSAVNSIGESTLSNEMSATATAPDTTAPTAPTGLMAAAVGTTQAIINWTASTDNVGVTGYGVYRDGVLVATVQTLYYLDAGLAAGTIHTYTVRALDAAGNQSQPSMSLSVATPGGKAATATLAGAVFASNGKPLSGASVLVTPTKGAPKTATTNSNGGWAVSNVSGTCQVTVSLAGYPTKTFSMSTAGKQTVVALTVLS